MQSNTIVLFIAIASILVMSQLVAGKHCNDVGAKCKRDSDCSQKCCDNNKCADSPNWCPCSEYKNPCNKMSQVCEIQQVNCIRAPCYPSTTCKPRWLPVTPRH